MNLKLVQQTFVKLWHEEFPDARVLKLAHRVLAPVPVVEIADDTHAGGLRRPNGERHTFRSTVFGYMRAKLFVDLFVTTFAEEMQIDIAKRRGEGCFSLRDQDVWNFPAKTPRRKEN